MESELRIVREITAEVLHADASSLKERTRFIDDLGADSLELFGILARIEEYCRVSFGTDSIKRIVTLRDAAAMLKEVEHQG